MSPSNLARDPFECVTENLRLTCHVVGLDFVDAEAGLFDESRDISGDVAAARNALPGWFDPGLPPCNIGIGTSTMLDKVESATWLEDATDLR